MIGPSTVRGQMRSFLTTAGWRPLSSNEMNGRTETWYRWRGPVRHELCLVYDARNALDTWSRWENTRVHVDGEAGRRERLIIAMQDWDDIGEDPEKPLDG